MRQGIITNCANHDMAQYAGHGIKYGSAIIKRTACAVIFCGLRPFTVALSPTTQRTRTCKQVPLGERVRHPLGVGRFCKPLKRQQLRSERVKGGGARCDIYSVEEIYSLQGVVGG